MNIIDILGWIGLLFMITSYYLVSKKKIVAVGYIFQVLNLVGALFLGINALELSNWSIVVLEIFWIFISIKTIYDIKFKKVGEDLFSYRIKKIRLG